MCQSQGTMIVDGQANNTKTSPLQYDNDAAATTKTTSATTNPSITVTSTTSSVWKQWLHYVWPVPPLFVLAVLPFLPTFLYLNRGYTIWFHNMTVIYVLTKSKFLQKYQLLSGIGVCFGWYTAVLYEFFRYGRVMTILYQNAPHCMRSLMFTDESMQEFQPFSWLSVGTMLLTNTLDLIGHPVLTYVFWKLNCRDYGSFKECLSWSVIVSGWFVSRFWSTLHSYHNFGTFSLFYVGHDIYNVDHLDSWYPAYVGENLVFAGAVLWKLYFEASSSSLTKVVKTIETQDIVDNTYDQKPKLVFSDSVVSVTSTVSDDGQVESMID